MFQIPPLAIILGAVGTLLVMVGVLGGGFTISTVTMPKVGIVPRITSLVVGGCLVLSSIAVGVKEGPGQTGGDIDASPPSNGPAIPPTNDPGGPPTFSAYINAPPDEGVRLFAAPRLSAAGLKNGQRVDVICTMQGDSVTYKGYPSTLWNLVRVGEGVVGFIPDVFLHTGTTQPTMPSCETLWNP
jgi:hypothetical protein